MRKHDQLCELASLISQRNSIENEISAIIGRPAHSGHIGEFVASLIFDIELAESASNKGTDGHFTRGCLAGKSVNVKKYSKNDRILDIALDAPPDFYLVLTRPKNASSVLPRHGAALDYRFGIFVRRTRACRRTQGARCEDRCSHQRQTPIFGMTQRSIHRNATPCFD